MENAGVVVIGIFHNNEKWDFKGLKRNNNTKILNIKIFFYHNYYINVVNIGTIFERTGWLWPTARLFLTNGASIR